MYKMTAGESYCRLSWPEIWRHSLNIRNLVLYSCSTIPTTVSEHKSYKPHRVTDHTWVRWQLSVDRSHLGEVTAICGQIALGWGDSYLWTDRTWVRWQLSVDRSHLGEVTAICGQITLGWGDSHLCNKRGVAEGDWSTTVHCSQSQKVQTPVAGVTSLRSVVLTVRLHWHNWIKSYLTRYSWSSLFVPQLPRTNCMTAAYNTIIQAANKFRTPVLHPQLCHELQICALPHGQFTLHRVHIFLQEVHQLAQWVGSPCQSLYWASQTFDLTASQLPFPAASCLPLLMPQEWDMQSNCVYILHWRTV